LWLGRIPFAKDIIKGDAHYLNLAGIDHHDQRKSGLLFFLYRVNEKSRNGFRTGEITYRDSFPGGHRSTGLKAA
jgi:hypothetical protein